MLNIYLDDYTGSQQEQVVRDVEKEFAKLRLIGTDIDKMLIKIIEHGRYVDGVSYIDRFGYKLHIDDMSTGCKAALCVANIPNKVIDLIECGYNARDAIIRYCKDGNIIMQDNGLTVSTLNGVETNVKIGGIEFDDIDALNKYINSGVERI